MSIRDDFRTYLLTKAGVTNKVDATAQRIYPGFLPQGVALPAIVLNTVSDIPGHDFDGSNTWAVARIQVDCYGSSQPEADAVAEAVRNACDGYAGNTMGSSTVHWCFKQDSNDTAFPEAENEPRRRYRVTVDYLIAYVQSLPTFT